MGIIPFLLINFKGKYLLEIDQVGLGKITGIHLLRAFQKDGRRES
jgi:hypothetical protein